MSTAWIAYMLLAGTIVAVAVLAVDAACRLAGWPRRWAPFGGLLLTIALAIIAPESTQQTSASIPFELSSFAVTENADIAPDAPVQIASPFSDAVTTVISAAERLPQVVASLLPRRFESFYNGAWAAASTILFLLFLLVHVRFHRARRGWPVFNLHGTNVRLSQSAGPAVVGAFRPDIVIPRWLLQREREQQRLVLDHEREHVRMRDPLMLATAWTCALAMPWHPAVWWMLWRLRLAVELDCDARVLAHGTPRRSYGALLIELSQQSSGLPVGATALSDRTTHLERRLLAMNTHRPSFFRLRSTAFALLAIAMIVSACALKKPASNVDEPAVSPTPATVAAEPQMATMTPPPTTPPAVAPVAGTRTNPLIIVDGVIQIPDPVQVVTVPPQAVPPPPVANVVTYTRPLIIIDGVIQMQDDPTIGRTPVPPAPTSSPAPQGTFTRPLIIIDGVIQMQDDPTIGAPRTPPPPAAIPPNRDTVIRTPPLPVPPVRPRVDTVVREAPLALQQQLGRLMIAVDGVIVQDTSAALRNLTAGEIASVEVVSGPIAISQFGERARDGVLFIRTKAFASANALSPLGGRGGGGAGGRGAGTVAGLQIRGGAAPGSDVVVQIRNPLSVSNPPSLVIVDGVIQMGSSADDILKALDITKIESIEIVRGAAAVSLYGARAANGVINIKMKR